MFNCTTLVPYFNLDRLAKWVADMNKKATKLGQPSLIMVTAPAAIPHYQQSSENGSGFSTNPADCETGVVIDMVEVTIQGEVVKLHGWEFIGKLSPNDGKNLILTVPNCTTPIAKLLPYIERVGVCEHCNTHRMRKETFLVQNESGEIKAVGRQCVKDFLGHSTPETMLSWVSSLCDIEEMMESMSSLDDCEARLRGMNLPIPISTTRWLEVTAAAIRKYGWVSKGTAEEQMICSTAKLVELWFHRLVSAEDKQALTPTEEDKATAAETLRWMQRPLPPTAGEYLHNLRTLAETGSVVPAGYGILTSAVAMYQKEKQEAETSCKVSAYVGTVGQRIVHTAKLLSTLKFNSMYGVVCLHNFMDEQGNQIVWFASHTAEWLKPGQKYTFRATVKKHEVYKCVKQTTVNRLEVLTTAEAH